LDMDAQVADLLGGTRVLSASVKSNLDLARATRKGLPAETAVQLVEAIRGSDVIVEAGKRGRRRGRSPKIVVQELEIAAISLTAMGPLGALIASLSHRASRRKTGEVKANASPARLTPEQSDVVIRTARTLAKAIDILGGRKKAAHWLTTPNRALGGEVPIGLLDTSAGAHEVETVLDRIEYGVYS
jgi:putative toxin-antitoxin system antitoxin component (TIGR02293 family)